MTCLARLEPSNRPTSSRTAKPAVHEASALSKWLRRLMAKTLSLSLTAKRSMAVNSRSTKQNRRKNAAALAAAAAVAAIVAVAVAATAVADTVAVDGTN